MTNFYPKRLILALLLLLSPVHIYSQIVNVETLRFLSDSNGWFGQLTSEVEYKRDKIEHIKIGAGVHTAYKMNKHNVLTNATFEYSKDGEKENENNFFLHLRYNYAFSNRIIYEAFYQTRYDDFLNIDQRDLYGTGIRFGITDNRKIKLFAGITAMYEYELLTNEEVHEKIRMSDYLSFRFKNDDFSFTSTMYYQPHFADFSDFRTTISSQLAFQLFSRLGMFINYNINYDSNRPLGIPHTVSELTGGLSLTFS